jgi:shikimate dehydrogenase
MIGGSTRLVGVMGWPVSHSRSPAMHNAAFATLGLDWAYVPLSVAPEEVGSAVAGLRALGFAGANVTVPHKQAVMPYLDQLTPAAQAAGAVNSIAVCEGGALLGDTTDGYGFLRDLEEHGVGAPRRAVVIGSGGAARSVVYALSEAGSAVTVCARNEAKAAALCAAVDQALPNRAGRLSVAAFPSEMGEAVRNVDLLVNATSLGLHEGDAAPWDSTVHLRPGQVAYDLIYSRETEFLKLAAEQGALAIDGLGMLVHQGARSFELWTGMAAPVEVMRAAVQDRQ